MSQRKPVNVRIKKPSSLTNIQIDQMCAVYIKNHNISKESCEERIKAGFDRIVLYEDMDTGEVVGFNGIRKRIQHIPGFIRPILAVYIGQLFIEKAYRGYFPFQKASLKIFLKHKIFTPWLKPMIWADALTFGPYLLMAQNSRTFYPHPENPTPERYQALLHQLGTQNYGENYNPETGCVSKSNKLVKEHVAPIMPRLLRNTFIRFFAEKNVGYEKGNGMLIINHYCWNTAIGIIQKVGHGWFNRKLKSLKQVRILVRNIAAKSL